MSDSLHVLFVCTGNTYRSPMAEAFFRAAVEERGPDFTTSSAGTLEGDRPIAPVAFSEIKQADHRMATHRSRLLLPHDIGAADLIIGMTREHVRQVVVLEPDAWDRTFTLKELVRRGGQIGQRRPGQTFPEWLASVSEGRARSDLLGDSVLDDIEDPLGRTAAVVRSVASEIRSAVGIVIELISPNFGSR